MMIGPDGVPIPIPVDETKLEMDGYFEAGYEDEYQEEYIPYQVPTHECCRKSKDGQLNQFIC